MGQAGALNQEPRIIDELTKSAMRAYEARDETRLPDGPVLVENSVMCARIPWQRAEDANSALDLWEMVPD